MGQFTLIINIIELNRLFGTYTIYYVICYSLGTTDGLTLPILGFLKFFLLIDLGLLNTIEKLADKTGGGVSLKINSNVLPITS